MPRLRGHAADTFEGGDDTVFVPPDEQRAGATPTGLDGPYDEVMEWVGPGRAWVPHGGSFAVYARGLDQAVVDKYAAWLSDGRWHAAENCPGVDVEQQFLAQWRLAKQGVALEVREHVTWTAGQWATPRGRTIGLDVRIRDGAQEGLF